MAVIPTTYFYVSRIYAAYLTFPCPSAASTTETVQPARRRKCRSYMAATLWTLADLLYTIYSRARLLSSSNSRIRLSISDWFVV